jgi:hypothetical protein
MIERRTFIQVAGGMAAAAFTPGVARLARGGSAAAPRRARTPDFELVLRPSRVFKTTPDVNRDRLEGWQCYLRLTSDVAEPVAIEQVVVAQRRGDVVHVVQRHHGAAAGALNVVPGGPVPGSTAPHVLALLRITATEPQSLALDSVRVEVTARRRSGDSVQVTREFPLEKYSQRTTLAFPFRGPGIITQGGAMNYGHRNASGMFAIDALGLTEMYGAMVKHGESPDCLAGWGRPIIAPAGGVVVVARGDRPDQPALGNADPKYFVAEFPDGGDPGNHVVIDHGNGEFSMIAHLQQGSLAVSLGQRVESGQRLGVMGNSGDSTATHVHHQLQSGPNWTIADALPHAYQNGPRNRHDRGWMFNARDA